MPRTLGPFFQLAFRSQFIRLSSKLSIVYCVDFVVSRCVPREHPPNLLGRGHYGDLFARLVVKLGQRPNISREI